MILRRLWNPAPWILLFLVGVGAGVGFLAHAPEPAPTPTAHSEAECFRKGVAYIDELKARIPKSLEHNREFIEDCFEGTKQHFIAKALELEGKP